MDSGEFTNTLRRATAVIQQSSAPPVTSWHEEYRARTLRGKVESLSRDMDDNTEKFFSRIKTSPTRNTRNVTIDLPQSGPIRQRAGVCFVVFFLRCPLQSFAVLRAMHATLVSRPQRYWTCMFFLPAASSCVSPGVDEVPPGPGEGVVVHAATQPRHSFLLAHNARATQQRSIQRQEHAISS